MLLLNDWTLIIYVSTYLRILCSVSNTLVVLGSVDVILVAQTMGLNTPNVDIRD